MFGNLNLADLSKQVNSTFQSITDNKQPKNTESQDSEGIEQKSADVQTGQPDSSREKTVKGENQSDKQQQQSGGLVKSRVVIGADGKKKKIITKRVVKKKVIGSASSVDATSSSADKGQEVQQQSTLKPQESVESTQSSQPVSPKSSVPPTSDPPQQLPLEQPPVQNKLQQQAEQDKNQDGPDQNDDDHAENVAQKKEIQQIPKNPTVQAHAIESNIKNQQVMDLDEIIPEIEIKTESQSDPQKSSLTDFSQQAELADTEKQLQESPKNPEQNPDTNQKIENDEEQEEEEEGTDIYWGDPGWGDDSSQIQHDQSKNDENGKNNSSPKKTLNSSN
eukprot:TRINITY_DN9500_c0_g2_i2.p1 TRINITY_DN9500_c0_g2~~TRINITY_DN9500_c0_g2_i2.p1  ORF type:complete len:334 (-),score=75.05 TRINITY_DN9500_c0_g2_i2:165-1166(-)